jgi:hypothetical protein
MFQGWENFYLMVGGAAGSLIGLLFIVATLTAGRDRDETARGVSIYMTPVVFHLAVVLVLSAVAMAPGLGAAVAGLVAGTAGVLGLVYSAWVSLSIRHIELTEPPHWTDFWWYGVAPFAVYVGLDASAVTVWLNRPLAAWGAGAMLMILLLVAIRNAWDMVTWMAPRAKPD